jgi:uncharacterized membrane protein
MSNVPPPPDVPPPPPPPDAGSGGYVGGQSPDAGAALSYGWKKFQENVGPLLAVILIPVAVQIVLNVIGQVIIRNAFGIAVFGILGTLLNLMLAIGIFNAGLMITSGQRVDVGKAFSTDRWGEWIVFSFLFGLFVGIGAIFCLIGALVVIAFWGLAPYYFLDQRAGIGEAFTRSFAKTREVSGLPLALGLTALVGVLGVIACYIGLFVTMPIAYTGAAYLYRRVNAQPVAP